eukprot:GHVR01067581.1.p3 GENE.GHVR01067581.1~~GHVR01067581.1.p3  ORF type:complete len:109 (+),score=8.94 GHVR01067581.1:2936-3262(+)
MRKLNNNRLSPFRQTTRPVLCNSGKKTPRKGSNSNRDIHFDGPNRSRSRSVKKEHSPPLQSSMMMTEGYGSDSDSESDNIKQSMARLKQRNMKGHIKIEKKENQKSTI